MFSFLQHSGALSVNAITTTQIAVVTAPLPNWGSARGGDSFHSHANRQQIRDPHKLFALAETQNGTPAPQDSDSTGCTGQCGQQAGAGTSAGEGIMS